MPRRSDDPDLAHLAVHPAQRFEIGQSQFERNTLARAEFHGVVRRYFRADLLRVYGRLVPMNDVLVERIFHIRGSVSPAKDPGVVRFVLGEEQFGLARADQPALAVLPVLQLRADAFRHAGSYAGVGPAQILAPG